MDSSGLYNTAWMDIFTFAYKNSTLDFEALKSVTREIGVRKISTSSTRHQPPQSTNSTHQQPPTKPLFLPKPKTSIPCFHHPPAAQCTNNPILTILHKHPNPLHLQSTQRPLSTPDTFTPISNLHIRTSIESATDTSGVSLSSI